MQAISDDLQAILKAKFQAAASGFRGSLEVADVDPGVPTCSMVLPTITAEISADQGAKGPGDTVTIPTPTPGSGNYIFIGACKLENSFTDIGSGTALIEVDAPWLTIGSFNSVDYDHMMGVVGYIRNSIVDAMVLGDGGSGGYFSANSWTTGIILNTDDTGPVQYAQAVNAEVIMPDGMTAGNVLVAVGLVESADGSMPGDWTTFAADNGLVIGARCIAPEEEGNTSTGLIQPDYAFAVSEWDASLLASIGETVTWRAYRPKRISVDKSLRLVSDGAEVELENEELPLGWGPTSVFETNQRCRIKQWYGDSGNAIQTFNGIIDRISDHRDVLTTTVTMRDMMGILIDETFSATAPQTAGEAGAVRTADNGVYLNMEVSDIVTDLLDRAGYPVADRDVVATSYVLDEFIVQDGASMADTIIGGTQLTGLVGYSAWTDELGVFHFAPTLISQNLSNPADPAYTFRAGEDITALDDETDQYDLRTRVKVRGPLTTTTLNDTWTEIWRTSKLNLPVGIWYDPTEPTHLRVIDRGTRRLYILRQADRAIVGSTYLGATIPNPLGLSGDPADATHYWILEAPWINGGSGGNKIKKLRKSDNAIVASFDIPSGRWSAIKATASYLYLTNLDTDAVHKKSKTDGSALGSFQHTYQSVLQANPSGLMVDGTTISVFWANGGTTARFLVCDESAPTTIIKAVKTTGTTLHGGEMDTTTHTECYGDSDSLGLVAKFTLVEAVDQTNEVFAEVVDYALEDELGALAQLEDRVHDAHAGVAHPWEARRLTLDLTVVTSITQANDTARRQLDIASQRRRVVDAGVIGNPAIQKTDYVAVVDEITGISTGFAVDTYRTEMSADGTYLGTIALLPVEAIEEAAVAPIPSNPPDDVVVVDPPGGTYPSDTTLGHPAINSDARPAYLTPELTDSTWGNKVRRITNTTMHRNQYARHQSWSKDRVYMYFPGYGGHLYDASNYSDLGHVDTDINFGVWSNMLAHTFYGMRGAGNVLAAWDAAAATQADVHTFSGFGAMYNGNYEGNLSDNDRLALVADSYTVVVYDIPNARIVSQRNFSPAPIDSCSMSRSGEYVVIAFATSGTGPTNGVWLYNASTFTAIRQIRTASGGHADQGLDAAGADIYVVVNDAGTGVISHRLADGTVTFLIGGVGGVCHVSCTNYERPGWAYISSTYNASPSTDGVGQIFAVKTDGSGTVEVFCFHHHGSETAYDAAPFAAASRDGALVTFGGAWGGDPVTQVYGFVTGVTT